MISAAFKISHTFDLLEIDWSSLHITDSQSVYDFFKKYCGSSDLTSAGSKFLMFRLDNNGTALHSQSSGDIYDYLVQNIKEKYTLTPLGLFLTIIDGPMFKSCVTGIPICNTFQKIGGYNNLYDDIFKYGTNGNMRNEKFYFYDKSYEKYVLWTWRGDYLNLGSGAEMGIYCDPLVVPGFEHWTSVGFELPMTLNLYNCYSTNNIENVFCWAPGNRQWWITGFNPDFMDVDVTEMAMIGKVDFTGREDMFYSLKDETEGNDRKSNFIIFDEDDLTAWVIWWEK